MATGQKKLPNVEDNGCLVKQVVNLEDKEESHSIQHDIGDIT